MTNTIRFFENMAQRMYHENDLSDMVYALCLTNQDFKQFFLDFFFEGENLKAENVSIEREVPYPDGSRPDFVIRDEGKVYFVEAKIWDRSHHFAQYSTTLKNSNTLKETEEGKDTTDVHLRLGYIANYEITANELKEEDRIVFNIMKKRVKQWKGFIDTIKLPKYNSWNNSEEVQGMIAYCKKVCPDFSDENIETYTYKADDFYETKKFYCALKDFLQQKEAVVLLRRSIKFYIWRKANIPAETMGFTFGMEDITENEPKLFCGKKVWGWVGLRLKGDHKGFCIAFDNLDGWGKPVFELLKDKLKDKPENTSWLPFCFAPPIVTEANNYGNYFKGKFEFVIQKLLSPKGFNFEDTKRNNPLPYYAVRALPLFIRQRVLPNLKIDGCRISTIYQKDTFNPSGWCGEYFSVSRLAKDSENGEEEKESRFWIGTYYDGRKGEDGQPLAGIVCEQIGGLKKTLRKWQGENVQLKEVINEINAYVCKALGCGSDEFCRVCGRREHCTDPVVRTSII